MKETLVQFLQCPRCSHAPLLVDAQSKSDIEIRSGNVVCQRCRSLFQITHGIPEMLWMMHEKVAQEQKAQDDKEVIVTQEGKKLKLTPETLREYKDLFLNFPQTHASARFALGGCYEGHVESVLRTFSVIDSMPLKPGMRVLDIGAHFGWASRRIAQKGCEVVALDLSHFLYVTDVFFEAGSPYFERVVADMHRLPFVDETFDVVLANAVIHHSQKGIDHVYHEIHRVLKPGGLLYNINECSYGLLEDKSGQRFAKQHAEGIHEAGYTINEYQLAALRGGFEKKVVQFSSFLEDYLQKKSNRNSQRTWKVTAAEAIVAFKPLHSLIQACSVPWRIVFRPKNWQMIGVKAHKTSQYKN
jgi:ubiquinone/menaquinone biosynthesis C-methylase UbiE/uncharacterized protein YbaR (Trm112 family)